MTPDVDTPPESLIHDRRTEWLAELEPHDYERCMALLEDLLGIEFRYSCGATSAALLRHLHNRPGGKPMLVAEMPPPALDPTLEGDISWVRPLSDSEKAAPLILALDVNAAYLAACSALPLGVGKPRHITWRGLEKGQVGYFRVHGYGWMTSVTAAWMAPGAAAEAWIWETTSQPLTPWYKVLRDARESLMEMDHWRWDAAIQAALLTVKHMYTDLIGRFASTKWNREGDPTFRPDARHFIQATRRTRVERVMSNCDPKPFAASCDQLWFAVHASPQVAGVRIGRNPGSWKVKGVVRHEDAVRAATEAQDLDALVDLVRE